MNWRPWLLAATLMGSASVIQAQTTMVLDTLQVQAGDPVVCLSKRMVFSSTLHVFLDERELPSETFSLDPKTGCLTLYLERSRFWSGILTARYKTLNFSLQPSFQRLKDPWITHTPVTGISRRRPTSPKHFTQESSEGLDVRGNQTLGITLGNRRDAKINQSLDVRISGRIGTDAEILAILSDQDIPFQPEGNTAELDELDQVLVEFKTTRLQAGLGDIDVRHAGPRFLSFDRKAEGVHGETSLFGATGRASFGSLKGEFKRSEFFGQDGLQGPYRLDGQRVIVAGSESIWMDGKRLQRGQDRDYTIDYNRAEILFTSAQPVTANSRITVDFEVAEGSFRRNLVFAGANEINLDAGGRLEFAYFSERDDVNRALGGELSPAERTQLQGIGDLARTVGSGVRYLGPGQGGEYRQIVDTVTGKIIFVFVDIGGEYAVDFISVGEGKGDYARNPEHSSQGREVYLHVGDGKGDFIVKRELSAPGANQVMDLRWSKRSKQGVFSAEGALSLVDQNTLSRLQDDDNEGRALWIEGSLEPLKLGKKLSVRPKVLHRSVASTFQAASPYQKSFQGWYWNLQETPSAGETVSQAQVQAAYNDVLTVANEFGRLTLSDSLTALRHNHSLIWSDRNAHLNGQWLSVQNKQNGRELGRLDRGDLAFRWVRWSVQPSFEFLTEERRTPGVSTATRSLGWRAGVLTPLVHEALTLETQVGSRRDDAKPDTVSVWSSGREERSASVELKGTFSQFSVTARYEGREVKRTVKEVHHLGRIDLRHQAYKGSWNAQTTWDLGTEAISRGGKSIVPDSTGYFDQFGNYVGAGGGYDVRFVQDQGPPELTSSVRMTTRLRWAPKKTDAVWRPLKHLAWDGFISLREASLESRLASLLSPTRYLDPEQVLDGNLRSRQTLDFFPRVKKLGFRVRHQLNRRIYRHRDVEGQDGLLENSRNSEWTLVLRNEPAPRWSLELEGKRGSRRESVQPRSGVGFEQDTVFRSLGFSGGRRFNSRAQNGRFSTLVSFSTERGHTRLAEGWRIEPRLQLTVSRKGRIDITGGWRRLTARRGFVTLIGPGAPLLTPGWDLNLRGEIKLWQGVNLSSAFRLDHPQGIDGIAEGRFEVRGAF